MIENVKKLVEELFEGAQDNDEIRALRDELMDNCQEHYRDLVESGMTPDNALRAVKESLNGMQEIVDRYSHMEQQEAEPAQDAEEKAEEKAEEAPAPGEHSWPAEEIRRIRVNAASHNVFVTGYDGDAVTVKSDRPEAFRVDRCGDALTVEAVQIVEEVFSGGNAAQTEENRAQAEPDRPILDMTLNELLHKVKSAVNGMIRGVERGLKNVSFFDDTAVRIMVPRGILENLDVNTASGDIRLEQICAPDLAVRTASGDLFAVFPDGESADRLFISSASGDISIRACAREARISSISGEVDLKGDYASLQCRSVSGDVSVEGSTGDLRSKSVSGDVQARLIRVQEGELNAETTSGDVTMILPAGCAAASVSTSTVSGDVQNDLESFTGGAPVRICVRTVSGDIRLCRAEA